MSELLSYSGDQVNAGDYSVIATFAGDANHFGSFATATITISKAIAAVVITGYTGTFDGASHGLTGTATGAGGMDLRAGLDLGELFTNAPGGTAHWVFHGGTNYTDQSDAATVSIARTNAVISVTPYDVTYDGLPHTATGIARGVQGEVLSGLSLNGTIHTSVGDYSTDPWTFTDITGNYNTASGTVHDRIDNHITLAAGSAYILNPTMSGAVTATGNASITLPGGLFVDSNSPSAILASGNARINVGGTVQVMGGISKSGNANVTKTGTPASISDPLASLVSPQLTGTNYGAVSVSGNTTKTLFPGVYSSIQLSGNAVVTMSPGLYIIRGGGFTVSGNAGVSGSGVTIFNAGSGYNGTTDSGNFGGISLSGNGRFDLSPPTSGPYDDILIYQSRLNTRAISISGNAIVDVDGVIYAANAMLTMSGNGHLDDALVVNSLNISGNVILTQMAAGSEGAFDAGEIASTLLAGDLSVYIDNSDGSFGPDMLDRIQDAIGSINTLLVSYSVKITEVDDPSLATLVLDTATTSASGGASDGVLGSYDPRSNPVRITILQGWNWYTGGDAAGVDADQHDFETTVMHEIGHALGLGYSSNADSPMSATLAAGPTHRIMAVADLNIPETPEGLEPLMAADFASNPPRPTVAQPMPLSVIARDDDRLLTLPSTATSSHVLNVVSTFTSSLELTQGRASTKATIAGRRPVLTTPSGYLPVGRQQVADIPLTSESLDGVRRRWTHLGHRAEIQLQSNVPTSLDLRLTAVELADLSLVATDQALADLFDSMSVASADSQASTAPNVDANLMCSPADLPTEGEQGESVTEPGRIGVIGCSIAAFLAVDRLLQNGRFGPNRAKRNWSPTLRRRDEMM